MPWSELFTVDTKEKIFALAGTLIGFFAALFILLAIIELVHTILALYASRCFENLRVRFIVRVLLYWSAKLIGLMFAIFAACAVAYADHPSAGGYVQTNIFVFIGLYITWRTLSLWPEFPRHMHCFIKFPEAKRAMFSHRDDTEDDVQKNPLNELWTLTDADAHHLTYEITMFQRHQKRVATLRNTTKERVPIGLFTTSRYTVQSK